MLEKIELFNMASAMAQHAGKRQALVARNMAHADTPHFQPTDLEPFSDRYMSAANSEMRTTRAAHQYPTSTIDWSIVLNPEGTETSPNGNAVSLETEMLRSVDIARQHSRALTIYQTSLGILRTSLGRG